jgi:two-component system phosphate regulon response regulator PhoB|uniref:Predicted response regulator n=1 Tax=uncultured bacterium MedeBAC49C08 TaxID=332274 RepID=Q4PK77_9BACT|nr:predicted response regulator [uncultured bacterium MedeBAC49C08]
MKKYVLLVEDEPDLNQTVAFNLDSEGYSVESAFNGKEALKLIEEKTPDLILLDLMLPDMSGLEICRILRSSKKTKNTPIMMVTAKGEEIDRIVGFELGADDYIVKPFSIREFMLRVAAMLKRSGDKINNDEEKIIFGSLEIDIAAHRVKLKDKEVPLTAKEFSLLHYLVERIGRVSTRDALLDDVWGYNCEVTTRTVDTHVKRLRAKLSDVGNNIETVRGVGYRFNSAS